MRHQLVMQKSLSSILDLTVRELLQQNQCVYINEEGHGTGQLFLDGSRVTKLVEVHIDAATDTFTAVKLQVTTKTKTEEVI